MPRSLYEPELFLKIINKKKHQLAEIEGELERLPLDHPTRLRWLERMLHLQQGIPALEAEYGKRTGNSQRLNEERIARKEESVIEGPVPTPETLEPEKVIFVRRKGEAVADLNFNDNALLNTYKSLSGTLGQARALVIANDSKLSIKELKNRFGQTELGKAADDKDWTDWIEIFSKQRTPPKAAALVFLEKKTGLKRSTIKKRCSKGRKRREVTTSSKR
jgi:hypothetical protein